MLKKLYRNYIQPIGSFNRDARLFLWMTVIDGVILSGWQLFFNIYMLERGFDREFLGLVNSLPSLAGLILGLPIGRLSDRMGRKQALAIGIFFAGLTMLGQVTFTNPVIISIMAALTGVFNMFLIVSISPLMMKLSDASNRTLLFSLNYGLQTLAGAVGSLFAGQLPAAFSFLLHTQADSATAYQAVLITSVLLGTTALIPLWKMNEPRTIPVEGMHSPSPAGTMPTPPMTGDRQTGPVSSPTRFIVKLAAPNFLIGIGAAILIPYMNVFFKDRFAISDAWLGILFSLSSLFIGVGSIIGPRLTTRLGGKIRTVAFTQFASIVFLLMVGFWPSVWVAGIALLLRAALMNMSAPLYNAFCMEQTPEHQQGFVSSVLNIAWQVGWGVGPYISGLVQEQFGFSPLFITTSILYVSAILLMWVFFQRSEERVIAVAA